MGIGTSEGIACDFQGPYYVSDRGRSMAFGNPTRALKVDISSLDGGSERWDECIQQANAEYNTRSKPNRLWFVLQQLTTIELTRTNFARSAQPFL